MYMYKNTNRSGIRTKQNNWFGSAFGQPVQPIVLKFWGYSCPPPPTHTLDFQKDASLKQKSSVFKKILQENSYSWF